MSYSTFSLSKVGGLSTDAEKGTYRVVHDQSQSSPAPASPNDRAGALFSIYSEVMLEADDKMVERWQKDADGIIIFTGLFAAVVATSLTVSFPDLRPNPQEISAFYLKQIYLASANSNTSIPSTVAQPPPFSPSWNTIWVNLLWILSLGLALTSAVSATILQQWARQFLRLTQAPEPDPMRKARIRALYARSTDKMFMKCLDYLLHCELHLSILLFSIGLLLFLFDINSHIFDAVLCLFIFFMVMYTFFTILPFVLRDSLVFTATSAFPVASVAFITCIVSTAFGHRFNAKLSNIFEMFFQYIETGETRLASDELAALDTHILEATLGSLVKDDDIVKFFEAIPSFFPSDTPEPLQFTAQFEPRFKLVMHAFLDRTFQTTTIAESVKTSRLLICLNASHAALGSKATSEILSNILNEKWPELLQSVEMGHSLRSWSNGNNDEEHVRYAQCIASRIIASTEKHDDRWSTLVKDELEISEDLLRDYVAQSDNVLLANFNNITRRIFHSHHPYWNVSSLLSKCDILRVLPSLQHDFCDLWNDILRDAQAGNGNISVSILKDIRDVYITLHKDTTPSSTAFAASIVDHPAILYQASSYPSCNVAAHRSHPLLDNRDEPAENVFPALVTHSSIQVVPPCGGFSVSGTRPLDIPAHYATSSPFPNLPTNRPFPTPPSDVTAIDAQTDASSTSGAWATSQQDADKSPAVPPSSVNSAVPRCDLPPSALGSPSPSTMTGRPHDIQDANRLQPQDREQHPDI